MSDATSCINAAIAANPAIRIPAGTWNIGTGGGNLTLHSNLLIVGDGPGTVIQRAGNIGSGVGVFDLPNLTNVRVSNLLIDGGVTTPATQDYATITGAMQSSFTANSTVWLHGGTNITLDHLTIQHTGGYAVIVDATANYGTAYNANGIQIFGNVFQNNRPFLFGTGTDLTYGSWPGGILWFSDGTSHNIQNLAITDNQFKYTTGTAIMGGAAALSLLNKNITVSGNLFQDIGLDGVLGGPVDDYTVADNNFLRIGYPSITDNTTGTAKWYNACTGGTQPTPGNPCTSGTHQSIPAVAIDSTAAVFNSAITGNAVVAHNGGCIDLDGATYSSITGNHCSIPQSGDPEYSDAQPSNWGPAVGPGIASAGQNWMYGVNTGNSSMTALGGSYLSVIGNTFDWQGGGAVRLYSANGGQVKSNHIQTPGSPHYNPITLGPSSGFQACGNEVSGNFIAFYGAITDGSIPAVYEDTQYGSFSDLCQNTVHDNRLVWTLSTATLSPFQKASASVSISYGALTTQVNAGSTIETLSQYLTCNSQSGSSTIACVTNQLELSGGNYLNRWYTPGGVLMATMSDDESFRIGNGSLGSLWIGGNILSDVTRNLYANSYTVQGTSLTAINYAGVMTSAGQLWMKGPTASASTQIISTDTTSAGCTTAGYPCYSAGNLHQISVGNGPSSFLGTLGVLGNVSTSGVFSSTGVGTNTMSGNLLVGGTVSVASGNIYLNGATGNIGGVSLSLSGVMLVTPAGLGAAYTGSKALCVNGFYVTVSSTNVCPP